jgi:hypothetical protein
MIFLVKSMGGIYKRKTFGKYQNISLSLLSFFRHQMMTT